MRLSLCIAFVFAVMLAGFSAHAAERADHAGELIPAGRPHVYGLYAVDKSGEFGTVTLTPIVGERTEADIALVGAPEDLQPVNVYVGACGRIDPRPRYALNYAVSGVSRTLLPAPITALTAGGLAINVHKSTSAVETYVSCGNIGGK